MLIPNTHTNLTFQLIPARGRKLESSHESIRMDKFQLIPARGRKRDADRIVDDRFDISTYPRKGTETWAPASRICWKTLFQLIPVRGRKHPQLPIPTTEMFRFQLIPARGRKPFDQRHDSDIITISTYPRKGTETSFEDLLERHLEISTYPRKGTVTACSQSSASSCHHFNLSPQGGKKLRIKNGAEFFFCVP